jgi:hypothetical protein
MLPAPWHCCSARIVYPCSEKVIQQALKFTFIAAGLIIILLAACTPSPEASPTAVSEARLTNGQMPKVLVTVAIPSTVNPTSQAATVEASPTESSTRIPATITPTATVYVGVFMGGPTSVGPDSSTTGGVISTPGTESGSATPPALTIASDCPISVAEPFQSAYNSNPSLQAFGCPQDSGLSISLVMQSFERGRMFWRDTRQILILAQNSSYWRVADTWQEGMPADDPSLVPPEGRIQPVRGFGLLWRTNPTFRDTLGWAQGPEFPLSSTWQEFEGGTLFLGDSNQIYAVPSSESGQYLGGIAP